ncbi:hypothetical protein NZK33_02270 [Cyanobium sp. FGCU-6]|nr:hypothetical protein [Cyanobium sp. FGCU6]
MTRITIRSAGYIAGIGFLGLACVYGSARAESIPNNSGDPGTPTTFGPTAQGGIDGGQQQPEENVLPVTEPEPAIDRFSGNAGIDFRSQYNARGIVVQDKGVTIQPYININYLIYQGKGFVNSVMATVGWWNDISTNTNVSSPAYTARIWTETDISGGLSIRFADRFTFSSTFTDFTSPAGGYREGRFINNVLAYNDAGLISPTFSLKPQFTFLYELPAGGQAGLQPNAWYFEPGLTPNITINAKSNYPINLALPLRVGLGNQFYNGTTYGFFSVGPQITVPLTFLSTPSAQWNLNVGYLYYDLGKTTAAIAPNGSRNQNVFNLGISVNF